MATIRTELRIPGDLHARLTARAQGELRSLNSMILIAVRAGLDEMDESERRETAATQTGESQ